MPIKVTCQCGKSFAVKDELAGKAVKCPNCQQPLRIPAAAPTAPSAAAAAAQATATASANAPRQRNPALGGDGAAAAASSADSLFDEIGLKAHVAGTRPCPGCAEPLPPDAVVCLKCGYNTKLGRRMQTTKVGMDDPMAGGHTASAADVMERAARVMDEDKEEELKKTGEGLPWWLYMVLLVVLVGFLGTMMVMANMAETKRQQEKEKEQKGSLQRPSTSAWV
jgi:hypothetical protein